MISICIPVYNYDISLLYDAFIEQLKNLEQEVEIIIIDDASNNNIVEINRKHCTNATYITLSKNVGRAKIRNLFLEYAKFEYLLFLDCDGLIPNSKFLSIYIDRILLNTSDVICGGRIYRTQKPNRNYFLNWDYGIKKESIPFRVRTKSPYISFMTNNFIIKKTVLQELRFDENIIEYGHEDTLFGFLLKHNNKIISHINNPVINGDLITNSDFMQNTAKGISNLKYIINNTEYKKDFIENITLLKYYEKIKKAHLLTFLNLTFHLSKPIIAYSLKKGVYIHLAFFDYYKLGLLHEILKKNA